MTWQQELEFVHTKDILEYLEARFDRFLFLGAKDKSESQEELTYHPLGTTIDSMGLMEWGKIKCHEKCQDFRQEDY